MIAFYIASTGQEWSVLTHSTRQTSRLSLFFLSMLTQYNTRKTWKKAAAFTHYSIVRHARSSQEIPGSFFSTSILFAPFVQAVENDFRNFNLVDVFTLDKFFSEWFPPWAVSQAGRNSDFRPSPEIGKRELFTPHELTLPLCKSHSPAVPQMNPLLEDPSTVCGPTTASSFHIHATATNWKRSLIPATQLTILAIILHHNTELCQLFIWASYIVIDSIDINSCHTELFFGRSFVRLLSLSRIERNFFNSKFFLACILHTCV